MGNMQTLQSSIFVDKFFKLVTQSNIFFYFVNIFKSSDLCLEIKVKCVDRVNCIDCIMHKRVSAWFLAITNWNTVLAVCNIQYVVFYILSQTFISKYF